MSVPLLTREIARACLPGPDHKGAYEDALCDMARRLAPTAPPKDGRPLDLPMYHTLRASYGSKHALVSVPLHRASCMKVLMLIDLIERPEQAFAPAHLAAFQSAIASAKDGAEIRAETTTEVINEAIKWLNADAELEKAIRSYVQEAAGPASKVKGLGVRGAGLLVAPSR